MIQDGGTNNFQGRYIIRQYWVGAVLCKNPSYGRWGGPPQGGGNKPTAATDLANAARGSVNLSRHVNAGAFDFDKLASTVATAVRQLDRVIDLNFYPIETAATANRKWRPVGLGVMGLQDVFFQLRLAFDSAINISRNQFFNFFEDES